MPDDTFDGVIAELRPSPGRRYLATGCMAVLAALLAVTALARPPALGWQLAMLAMAVASAWMAQRTWAATSLSVIWRDDGLYDSAGTLIAPLDEIESVDRRPFAFKPSNGFLIRLRTPGPRGWQPGLWWRMGRRVGVGGTLPGAPARILADEIAMTLARRDAG